MAIWQKENKSLNLAKKKIIFGNKKDLEGRNYLSVLVLVNDPDCVDNSWKPHEEAEDDVDHEVNAHALDQQNC